MHDLGRVQRARRVEERLADVGADDLVVGAAELLDELALLGEELSGRRGESVLRDDVDGDEVAVRALRHPGRAADEPLAVGEPVSATSTRSRVSQGCSMPCRARYAASPRRPDRRSRASASSRSAPRLPGRK